MSSLYMTLNDLTKKLRQLNELRHLCENLDKIAVILCQNNSVFTGEHIDSDSALDSVFDSEFDFKLCKSDVERAVNRNKSAKSVKKQNKSYFKCFWPKCQYRAVDEISLKRHFTSHYKRKQYKCQHKDCNKMFKYSVNLRRHESSGHSSAQTNGKYVCDWSECNQTFAAKSDLSQHKNDVHLNPDLDKQFKCDFKDCIKSFNTKYGLIRHKLIHSEVKPFVCDYSNCLKSFTQKTHLMNHKRRHNITNNSAGCAKAYVPKSELKVNRNNVGSVPKIVVPKVEPKVSRNNVSLVPKSEPKLNRNSVKTNVKLMYKCMETDCNKSFKSNQYLRYHKKIVHKLSVV